MPSPSYTNMTGVGGEEVHQHSIHSEGTVPFTLSGHEHSIQGHYFCQIPFRQAVVVVAASRVPNG